MWTLRGPFTMEREKRYYNYIDSVRSSRVLIRITRPQGLTPTYKLKRSKIRQTKLKLINGSPYYWGVPSSNPSMF